VNLNEIKQSKLIDPCQLIGNELPTNYTGPRMTKIPGCETTKLLLPIEAYFSQSPMQIMLN